MSILVWVPGLFSSILSGYFFPHRHLVSSHAWGYLFSAEYSDPLQISRIFSLCSSLLTNTLPCEFQMPWAPWIPRTISLIWGHFWLLPWYPPCTIGQKLFPVSWSSIVCFLSFWGHFTFLPNIQCMEQLFHIFCLVYSYFRWESKSRLEVKVQVPGFF